MGGFACASNGPSGAPAVTTVPATPAQPEQDAAPKSRPANWGEHGISPGTYLVAEVRDGSVGHAEWYANDTEKADLDSATRDTATPPAPEPLVRLDGTAAQA